MKTNPFSFDTAPRRVLIVDDHLPTLLAVSEILDREAPEICVSGLADSGAAGLRLAQETTPDVVVLDLDLGSESGLDLIPAFVRNQASAVIVFSASGNAELRRQALAAGASGFVSKFAPVDELISAVLATNIVARI